MCRELGIAPSGYYAWQVRSPSKNSTATLLSWSMSRRFKASRHRYGSPRVHAELRAEAIASPRKRIARLMRQDGLRARSRRTLRAHTQSRHKFPIAGMWSLAVRGVGTNQVWVSDLTYLRSQTGFVYIGPVVLDLFRTPRRRWAVSQDLDAGIGRGGAARALAVRPAPAGMIHHSAAAFTTRALTTEPCSRATASGRA